MSRLDRAIATGADVAAMLSLLAVVGAVWLMWFSTGVDVWEPDGAPYVVSLDHE